MIRLCPGCTQSDDQPRHSVVSDMATMRSADFHYACHARMGCPLCLSVMASADAFGIDVDDTAALTAHLAANDPAGAHIAAGGAHL